MSDPIHYCQWCQRGRCPQHLICGIHGIRDCQLCWKKIFREDACYPHNLKACYICHPRYFDLPKTEDTQNVPSGHKWCVLL